MDIDLSARHQVEQLHELQRQLQRQIDTLKRARKELEADVANLQANARAISSILVDRGIATEDEIDRRAAEALEALRSMPVAAAEGSDLDADAAAQEVYKDLGLSE